MNNSNASNHAPASNVYYKLLAENTVECIWLFDLANKKFKYISPAIMRLRGLTVEEALQEKLEDCLTPESMEKLKHHALTRLPRFLAGDRSEEITSSIDEYQQYCKDGTIKTFEISIKFIPNEETKSIDILGVSRDRSSSSQEHTGIKSGSVYCFGKLLVYGKENNFPIKWRTSKSEELFAYLLQHNAAGISKWKICENLWPECSGEKVDTHLHTTLYKMKKSLQLAHINFNIKFQNGCYWIDRDDLYIDTAEFDAILHPDISITDETIKTYEKAFSLYKNDYLEGNDYIWSVAKREQYAKKYCQLAAALVKYYSQKNNYSSAERILLKTLEKFPLEELPHELLLKLYFIQNDRLSFIHHYHKMYDLFKSELGIIPNKAIQTLYHHIENS